MVFTYCRLPATRNVVGKWLRMASKKESHSSSIIIFCAL
jgi:hypothetical protein